MANNLPALFASNANVPAFLKGAAVDNALAAHHTSSFKVLSIKGKNWTVTQGDEKNILMNPKDPDSPASYIEVVIVKASPIKHKVWYASNYQDGAEVGKPDCFSTDGMKPDPQSEKPQSKTCALCKKNQFGTKSNQDGSMGKGKACNDVIRMAVAAPNAIDDPMLLRIPPASIKPAGDYGKLLQKRGVPLNGVITKLVFDKDAPTPRVLFEPVGFVDAAQFAQANEVADSEVVDAILGMSPVEAPADEPADALGAVPEHLKPAATKPVAKPKAPEKTAEELEAEAEEKALADLLAKKAARKAKEIQPTKAVKDAEIEAAVEAAERNLTVAGAKDVSETDASQVEVDAGSINVDAIPDLATISFDD
jgi:hypothetical protein